MIRAILALLFAVLYLILGIPVLFVEWIIRKCNRHAADISSLRMVQWAFRVIMFICGVKLTVIGEENVPKMFRFFISEIIEVILTLLSLIPDVRDSPVTLPKTPWEKFLF